MIPGVGMTQPELHAPDPQQGPAPAVMLSIRAHAAAWASSHLARLGETPSDGNCPQSDRRLQALPYPARFNNLSMHLLPQ